MICPWVEQDPFGYVEIDPRVSTEHQNSRKGLTNSSSANRTHFTEASNMAFFLLPNTLIGTFDYPIQPVSRTIKILETIPKRTLCSVQMVLVLFSKQENKMEKNKLIYFYFVICFQLTYSLKIKLTVYFDTVKMQKSLYSVFQIP